MKILFFAGSLRAESCNKKLAREAMRLVQVKGGHDVEFIDLKDYPMSSYDGDDEFNHGVPETAKSLGAKIAKVDAIILSTPEYNGSIPGTLKNVVDWLSRDKPVSMTGKALLLLAASPGALGGVRSLWQTRVPFEVLGVNVFPGMMGLPNAYNAFDEQNRLQDEKIIQQLQKLLDQFLDYHK